MKELNILKNNFLILLGEAHVWYGIIESELKDIWWVVSHKQKLAHPNKIEHKWKKIEKMTLGQIIEEIDYLSVYSSDDIDVLKNDIKPERNRLTHKIQYIFYDDKRLTDRQNVDKLKNSLNKEINKLQKQNKRLRIIATDLVNDRISFANE